MDVASPSSTEVGPVILMVMGSLAAMVAWAELAPFFSESCEDSVDVIAPSVTVKDSAVSDSASSVAVMVMDCVAPAAELAAKVTVPDVAPRSDDSAESVPRGADHATCTAASTAFDSVTVKTALPPSDTLEVGPVMLSSAESLSPGTVVVDLSSSVRVMIASLTLRPATVVVPDTMIVSSPSTTVSSVGVILIVPVALAVLAGMVMLARVVAE